LQTVYIVARYTHSRRISQLMCHKSLQCNEVIKQKLSVPINLLHPTLDISLRCKKTVIYTYVSNHNISQFINFSSNLLNSTCCGRFHTMLVTVLLSIAIEHNSLTTHEISQLQYERFNLMNSIRQRLIFTWGHRF
jgi:hypothetical protein